VNGHEVGTHRGGYDAFAFDITDDLSQNGRQELSVAVSNPTEGDQPRGKQSRRPEGIFYSASSGIWQTAWLEPVPVSGITDIKEVPDLDAGSLRLHVFASDNSSNLKVEATAFADGVVAGQVSGPANTELVLPVSHPRLWSPDNPFLYELRIVVKDHDRVVDAVSSYFGMRSVGLHRDEHGVTRIMLNGKFTFELGVLDQGFWPDGIYTAPTDAALRSDIEFLKKAGFNFTRKHVKIEPDRWYYWCDKLGLLVWQDMPSGNNATVDGRRDFENELFRMVDGLHNHPCIVVWVLFNEGWGQYDTEALAKWLKELDPSRLVDDASGWTDMQAGDLMDIHNYPGPGSTSPEAHRAAVLGEFGGFGFVEDGYSWSSHHWGYVMMTNVQELADRYTEAFKQVWELHNLRGLSAAVYTQTADVETECNGLMTYDRKILKPDLAAVSAANRKLQADQSAH
jgi:beta-galactosidase/beta-glucuronidase